MILLFVGPLHFLLLRLLALLFVIQPLNQTNLQKDFLLIELALFGILTVVFLELFYLFHSLKLYHSLLTLSFSNTNYIFRNLSYLLSTNSCGLSFSYFSINAAKCVSILPVTSFKVSIVNSSGSAKTCSTIPVCFKC